MFACINNWGIDADLIQYFFMNESDHEMANILPKSCYQSSNWPNGKDLKPMLAYQWVGSLVFIYDDFFEIVDFRQRAYQTTNWPAYLTSIFKVIYLALLWWFESCENQTRAIDF